MKKLLFIVSIFALSYTGMLAQAPQGINYQGVARDAMGQAIGMTSISVQVSFLPNGSSTPVYQERQAVTTDTFGLYSLVIGSPGAVVTMGTFASIPWSNGNLSVQVDIDPSGGTAFTTVSTMTLQSVPYALYAQSSGNSSSGTVTNVSVSPPMTVSTPSTTPAISITQAGTSSDGYLSMTDWNNFNNKVSSIATSTGILASSIGQSYTLTADNGNPIWNASKLQGVPVNVTAPLTNDVLTYNGTNWIPMPATGLPAGSNGQMMFHNGTNWTPTNTSNLTFTGTMLGIGNATPNAFLDVQTTGTNPAIKATSSGGSTPAILANGAIQMNGPIIDAGATVGANGDVLISQGPGLGPKWAPATSVGGPWTSSGNNVYPSNASYSVGIGTTTPGATLDLFSAAGSAALLKGVTSGTGFSAQFSGGAGVQVDKIQIMGGANNGYVLTSDNVGNATWQPAGGGSLPGPALGALLFAPTASTWAATNPSNISSDGTSITVANTTTVGTAGTFITNNTGASNAAALVAQSNSSTGYAIKADNTNGAAIVANSGGPYTITGNLNGPSGGNAVVGYLRNGAGGGTGIAGWVDNTSSGNAGNFDNQNPANTQPVLMVTNVAGSSGKSAIFSGGSGVQIDNLEVQTNLHISPGANAGFVLTSNATGDASWQAPPGGVTTVTVNAPLANTGTPTAPIINLPQANGTSNGYLSSTDWTVFNNKVTSVSATGPISSTGGQNPSITLSTSGVTAGTYGGATVYPVITVDSYGRITTATTQTASVGTVTSVSTTAGDLIGGPITSSGTLGLANTGVTPGAYGGASSIPTFTVDAKGRITNITNTSLSTSGTLSGGTPNYIPKWLTTNSLSSTSLLFDNGTAVGLNTATPGAWLDIVGTALGTAPALKAVQGNTTHAAGVFTVTAATNSAPVLNVGTAGTGVGVSVSTIGGNGVDATNSGTSGAAGSFNITNNASTGNALFAQTIGSGSAISATTSGNGDAVSVTTSGTGMGVFSQNTSATTGGAGLFKISSSSNTSDALKAVSSGSGNAVVGTNVGNGGGAFFSINTAGNTSSALTATTNGAGFSGNFSGGTGLKTDGVTAAVRVYNGGAAISLIGTDFFVLVPTTATPGTINLPAANASNIGKIFVIKNLSTSTVAIGGATFTSAGGSVNQGSVPSNTVISLISDGTTWQAW